MPCSCTAVCWVWLSSTLPPCPLPLPAFAAAVCGQKGVAAKPRKGDALLFFSVLPDGESVDERSLHASCPVVKGEKWVASKWLRESEWIDAPLSQLDAVKQERELLKLREIQARIAATGDHTTM